MRRLPSQVKGAGFRSLSRRSSRVQISPSAPFILLNTACRGSSQRRIDIEPGPPVLIVIVLVGDFLARKVTCAAFPNGFERVLAIRRSDSLLGAYVHNSILDIPLLDVLS